MENFKYRAKVEKGIPIPDKEHAGKQNLGGINGQFGHIQKMDIGDSVAVRDERSANIFHSYANKKRWGVTRRRVDEGDGAFEYRIWRVK
tara:strand:- start:211 stop:477 length:267 start_codon:yes stop_codon:yes gene_type:complete